MSEHIIKRHNKTLLLYQIVFPVKYRRKIKEGFILKFIQGSSACSSSDTSGLCPGVVHFYEVTIFLNRITILFLGCLWSCNESVDPFAEQKVSVSLRASVDNSETIVLMRGRNVSTDSFNVVLNKITDGESEVVDSYDNYVDVPDTLELDHGTYSVSVSSSNDGSTASFDAPYYSGQSDAVTIAYGEHKDIEVVAKLSNIKASVTYDESATSNLSFYEVTIAHQGNNGSSSLVFGSDETRAGYFADGGEDDSFDILVTGVNPAGDTIRVTHSYANPQIQHHYKINVGYEKSNTTGSILIDIDGEVIEKDIDVVLVDANPEAEFRPFITTWTTTTDGDSITIPTVASFVAEVRNSEYKHSYVLSFTRLFLFPLFLFRV